MFLGGLPAAALAMIMAADKQKRRQVATFLGGVGVATFLTRIDEPLAFSFIFVSPLLGGFHALFNGILGAATIALKIKVGFGFSDGFIDYVISFAQSWGLAIYQENSIGSVWKWLSNPLMVFPLAIAAFQAYYFVFVILIKKFDIKTPGREVYGIDEMVVATSRTAGKSKDYDAIAENIIQAVGIDNFEIIENCATRLRLTVQDNQTNVDDKKIKEAGAYAIKRLGRQGLQIVIGTDVEHVADKIKEKLGKF